MNTPIETQLNPYTLKFKNERLEQAYGGWDIEKFTRNFHGGLAGSAALWFIIFGLDLLILGRWEWNLFWIAAVCAPAESLLFTIAVRWAQVRNRSQLDTWGGLFIGTGQIWQYVIALTFPELGGQYLFASVIMSIMGNSAFTSLNFRYIIPIVLSTLTAFLLKVCLLDNLATPQLVFEITYMIIFTSIGLTSGYVMERSTRLNFVHQTDLERQQQALLSKNKELEQFAYIASHDLQEPLRSVTSFSQLIDEEYRAQIGEEGGQYLDYLQEASKRMRNLIKGLLDYSRLGSEAQLVDVNTAEVLRAVRIDLSTAIAESKATITSGPLPILPAYETEFRQLLQNLLSNALKFRREDVAPEIRITATKHHDRWEFSVQDNGIGIAPEHQEKIFLIFQRLHNRSMYEGTGIGLANCRKIVELHGGTLRVVSERNQGSNFIFTIPTR